MTKLIDKIKKLPAYSPNGWGTMCEADQDDPVHFPCRMWVRRADVIRLVEKNG